MTKLNGYQSMKADEIITLRVALNRQLVRVIYVIPEDKLNNICVFSDGESISTDRLMDEVHLIHLEHHLEQIIGFPPSRD